MKATLEFDLYEERDAFDFAFRGHKYAAAIEDIRNEIFRPVRKHGYPSGPILYFLEAHPEPVREILEKFIGILEGKFCEIVSELEE